MEKIDLEKRLEKVQEGLYEHRINDLEKKYG